MIQFSKHNKHVYIHTHEQKSQNYIHKQAKYVYKNDTTQERLDHVKAKEGQLTELNK